MAGKSTTSRRSSAAATYDFECPECEFVSTGWATKGKRDERGRLHKAEHDTGERMVELGEFRDPEGHRDALEKAGVKS